LCNRFPDIAEELARIQARLFDLLPLTKKYYCHPDMRGSWSIKSVLPTVAPELDYGDLDVQGGQAAQQKYMDLLNQEVSEDDLKKGRNALLKYCERDTLAMVKLAQFLAE
jgi:hypothetical protein